MSPVVERTDWLALEARLAPNSHGGGRAGHVETCVGAGVAVAAPVCRCGRSRTTEKQEAEHPTHRFRVKQNAGQRAWARGILTDVHEETTIDASPTPRQDASAFIAVIGERREVIPLPRGEELSVGRSRSSHIVLADAEASRLQATLHWDGTCVWLTERGSRNGTFVRGERVRGRAALRAGDVITIGETRMVVIVERSEPTEEAELIVESPVMKALVERVDAVAKSDASVLFLGETGVGKEVLARRLHASSTRADGPFVAINCAAIPDTLAESVLFGHERGAFTGAHERKIGVFEASSGGTLFLDEVGELTPRTQARMLRVLETKNLTRVGGTEPVRADVRIVSATHRELAHDTESFRADLYYRLAVVSLEVPPLRDRPEDIEALARHFIRTLAPGRTLDPEALTALLGQPWPGNVRELRNVLEAALTFGGDGARVGVADLPLAHAPRALDTHLEEVERVRIARALDASEGNQSAAARRLGISRRALIYRMEKLGLKKRPASAES